MSSRLVRWRALIPVSLALLVSACDAELVAASLGTGGTTLFALTPDAFIGTWSHNETSDGPGGGVVTQTTWHFVSGGAATRTITTFTTLGAILSTNTTPVTWTVSAGVLLLNFGPPSFQIVRVPYVIDFGVQSTTLVLDGVPYQQVDS